MKTQEAICKLRDTIRLRHFAMSTEQSYCAWLARFARFISERCPAGDPNAKMEAFLTQLARQEVSASTQMQAFNASLMPLAQDTEQLRLGVINAADKFGDKELALLEIEHVADEVLRK